MSIMDRDLSSTPKIRWTFPMPRSGKSLRSKAPMVVLSSPVISPNVLVRRNDLKVLIAGDEFCFSGIYSEFSAEYWSLFSKILIL